MENLPSLVSYSYNVEVRWNYVPPRCLFPPLTPFLLQTTWVSMDEAIAACRKALGMYKDFSGSWQKSWDNWRQRDGGCGHDEVGFLFLWAGWVMLVWGMKQFIMRRWWIFTLIFFTLIYWLSVQDLTGNWRHGKRVSEMLQTWAELRRCYGSQRLRDDGDGVRSISGKTRGWVVMREGWSKSWGDEENIFHLFWLLFGQDLGGF